MFSFLKNSVPKNVAGPSVTTDSKSMSLNSTREKSDIQRELIRVVLKDTLRRLGIPFDWLSCEVIIIPHGMGNDELHIQLSLMKWHETFLRYGPALERQLVRGLDRFDPSVDHSKYIISWRFAPDCGCPFTVMPPPRFWTHVEPPAPAVVEEAPSVLDRRHSKRPPKAQVPSPQQPKAVAPHRPPPDEDEDYERTQLSPLR